MPASEPSTAPSGMPWRPGMPTRCRACRSERLVYDQEGSGTCLVCGAVTEAGWAEPGASEPTATPPPSGVTSGASYYPPLILGERAQRDGRLVKIAAVVAVLVLVFLFLGLPALLSFDPAPIIHLSDVYLTKGLDCTVFLDFILTNTGARDGWATVGLSVNGAPYANWTYLVQAHTYHFEGPSAYVAGCLFRSYDVAILFVTSA